jgi:hypothetical protein
MFDQQDVFETKAPSPIGPSSKKYYCRELTEFVISRILALLTAETAAVNSVKLTNCTSN